MIEQNKVNRARMIGYAFGIVAFVTVVAWRFAVR